MFYVIFHINMNTTIETVAPNVCVMEYTRENLITECSNLKKLLGDAQTHIETKNQQIHDHERECNRLKCLENEYLQEIETLQSVESDVRKKFEGQIHSLEEKIVAAKQAHDEHVDSLKVELVERDSRIEELQNDMKLLTRNDANQNDVESLRADNLQLKESVQELSEQVEELKEIINGLEAQNVVAQDRINNLEAQAAALHESYKCKKEELHEANTLIDSLQEDIVVTRNELDLLKARPLDSYSQGNSLFAEVDSRRLQQQQIMADMKVRYKEMQREKSIYLKQISDLQLEVATLCRRWDEELKEREGDDFGQKEALKTRIKTLEALVASYQHEISERQTISSKNLEGYVVEFIEGMINSKNKEIEKQLEQINNLSLSHALLSTRLRDANAETRKWKASSAQLHCQVGQLKIEIDKLKLKSDAEELKPELKEFRFSTQNPHKRTSQPKLLNDIMRELQANRLKLANANEEEEKPNFSNVNLFRPLKKVSCSNILERPDEVPKETVAEVDKENSDSKVGEEKGAKKKVQFSKDTVEPSVTDRSKLRRGGKVIHAKPVHVPSIKKKEM